MRRSLFGGWCLIFGSLLLAGCSTLKQNAAELLEKKEYGDALAIYERVLADSPHDAEALSGRNQSRLGLIQKELIEVRFLRLSGQQSQGNETLLRILNRVKDWSLYPEGPVAFTQFEEMSFASRAVEKDVVEALARRRPFRAAADLQKWAALFPAERGTQLAQLKDRTKNLGIEQCASWRDQAPGEPFFARFLWRSCGLWGQPEMSLPPAPELFAWLEPRLRWFDARPDPALEIQLREKLQTAFRESPWFDANAGNVALAQVEPRYRFRETRTPVELVHAYLVQVPYDSSEVVELSRWVPDDRTESVRDSSGQYKTEVVRGSRQVHYTEMRTVTRMRDEVRSIPYDALKIELEGNLDFDLRFDSALFDDAKKVYSAREDETLIQHGNDSPDVRLKPQNPRVPSSGEVFGDLAGRLTKEFGAELGSLWRRKFCRAPKGTKWSAVAENVQKCLYGAGGETPDYAEQWLNRELGVTSVELKALTQGLPSAPAAKPLKLRNLSSASETRDPGP
ncbi:MAG: hypothetical protein KF767_16575 [Bdellovibrionaceae bacterium]|nr:hypothetical protein [Pseudobdellovibrionaceae bacterium]